MLAIIMALTQYGAQSEQSCGFPFCHQHNNCNIKEIGHGHDKAYFIAFQLIKDDHRQQYGESRIIELFLFFWCEMPEAP